MQFHFNYSLEFSRIMPANIIDSRKGTPLDKALGSVIKSSINTQIALIQDDVLLYKIESEAGGMAGFFAVKYNTEGDYGQLFLQQLRPSYELFFDQINEQITNFIQKGDWRRDYLFS